MSPIFLLLVILLIAFLFVLSWFHYERIKVFMRKVRALILCQASLPPEDPTATQIGAANQQVYFIGRERIKIEPLPDILAPTPPAVLQTTVNSEDNIEKY